MRNYFVLNLSDLNHIHRLIKSRLNKAYLPLSNSNDKYSVIAQYSAKYDNVTISSWKTSTLNPHLHLDFYDDGLANSWKSTLPSSKVEDGYLPFY